MKITPDNTIMLLFRSGLSFINDFSSIVLNFPDIFTIVFNSFLKIIFIKTNPNRKVTSIDGAILMKKELKSIFAAEPIMIFGGSPIKVAAPPILDERVCPKIKGIGEILKDRNMDKVTGTISKII